MRKLMRCFMMAVLLIASFVTTPFKNLEARPTDLTLGKPKSNSEKLILKHAREIFRKNTDSMITWHYSHYSHGSHYSHYSHASHRSHYSSWF